MMSAVWSGSSMSATSGTVGGTTIPFRRLDTGIGERLKCILRRARPSRLSVPREIVAVHGGKQEIVAVHGIPSEHQDRTPAVGDQAHTEPQHERVAEHPSVVGREKLPWIGQRDPEQRRRLAALHVGDGQELPATGHDSSCQVGSNLDLGLIRQRSLFGLLHE